MRRGKGNERGAWSGRVREKAERGCGGSRANGAGGVSGVNAADGVRKVVERVSECVYHGGTTHTTGGGRQP